MISEGLLQRLHFTHNRFGHISILQDREGIPFAALITENDLLINRISDARVYEYTLILSGLSLGSNVSKYTIYDDAGLKRALVKFKPKTNAHNRFIIKYVSLVAFTVIVGVIVGLCK
jgi:hypothetical protein